MAVDSKTIFQSFVILLILFLGVVMAVSVTTNAAGGLAALVPLITALLALLALINPRAGLFGLSALVIWVDEFKRLAVYFGGADSMTVMQTLAMPFIVLAALNAGYLLGIMFGKVKIDRIGILIYALATLIGVGVFITMDASFQLRAQRAANITGYMTLIPICYSYFKTFDDWKKYFSFQVIVALPSAAWAIKQYYYGFDQIEWDYARSGLSPVHYFQMFGFENPRSFGFFGSASALGCAAIYCAYSFWHLIRYRSKRLFWAIAAILLVWALIASTQRTVLIYPLIVLVCSYAFRTRIRVLAFYITAFFFFLVGIASSDYMLDKGLDNINRTIASSSSWGSEVLKVSTFSDRLRGWQRLKRLESWSIFGTGQELVSSTDDTVDVGGKDYNHDVINKILIHYGILGLMGIFIPAIFVLRALHRTVFRSLDITDRNDAAFALALSLPMIFLSLIGGDNFNTNPINIQIWTAIAGVFVCKLVNERLMSGAKTQAAASTVPALANATP